MGNSINPFPLGDALTAGASVIGGITSMINANKAIKAQQAENEKTRQYNLNLAKQQNAWNIEQWNRENAYNSPAAMMARYESAGLNPALMYSQQNPSAPSPVMTSGAPAQSADMGALKTLPSIGDMTNDFLNKKLVAAQIDKIQSETKGQDTQNRILATDADIKDLTKGNVVKASDLNLQLLGNNVDLSETENKIALKKLDEISWNIEELKSKTELNYASAANVDEDTINKRFNNNAFKMRLDLEMREGAARIKELFSRANLNNQQANEIAVMLPYMVDQAIGNNKLISEKIFETYANRMLTDQKTLTERVKRAGEFLKNQGLELSNEGLKLNNAMLGKQNSWWTFDHLLGTANGLLDCANKSASWFNTTVSTGSTVMKTFIPDL